MSVEVVERVAALDVGKAMLVACVRVPHEVKPGRRRQEVRTFATTTRCCATLGMTTGASSTVTMWVGMRRPRRQSPAGLGAYRVAVLVSLP